MALDHEVEALAARADAIGRRRLMERMRLLFRSRTIHAYRSLFLDATGALTSDAQRVLADLGRVAKMGVADTGTVTDADLRERSGRRSIVLHMIARMDLSGAQLRVLADELRRMDQ